MQKRRTCGTRPKSSTWIHSEVTQTAQAGKNKKAIASIINNHNSITPSIQCNSPSIESRPITSTDIVTAPTSNWVKMRSTGPRTDSGKTRDQCDEESDLRARSCSNSYRQVHFVLHSHHDNRRVSGHIARSGARITPTKNCVIPHALAAWSYTPIYISFIAATNTITAAGIPIEREQLQHCSLKSEAS